MLVYLDRINVLIVIVNDEILDVSLILLIKCLPVLAQHSKIMADLLTCQRMSTSAPTPTPLIFHKTSDTYCT